MSEENPSPPKPDEGINILFSITNNCQFEIDADFNNPNTAATESFGAFLSFLENGEIFNPLVESLIKKAKSDKKINKIIKSALKHKNQIDAALDRPVVNPEEVFNFNHNHHE